MDDDKMPWVLSQLGFGPEYLVTDDDEDIGVLVVPDLTNCGFTTKEGVEFRLLFTSEHSGICSVALLVIGREEDGTCLWDDRYEFSEQCFEIEALLPSHPVVLDGIAGVRSPDSAHLGRMVLSAGVAYSINSRSGRVYLLVEWDSEDDDGDVTVVFGIRGGSEAVLVLAWDKVIQYFNVPESE